MKKLQIKQKISSVLKRFPHYILVGVIALAIATTLVVLWLVRSSSATNDLNLVRSYPLTPLEDTTFNRPLGMSRDTSGNFYVVDSANARIQKFDSDGNFISQFGARGSSNGSLSKPVDVTIDSSGNIYVANIYGLDFGSWQVVKYNSSGTWLATWDGATDINSINAMLAADSNDNIYVYDVNNYNVTKYDSDGNQLNQWALEKPEGAASGCYGCAGGLAFDSSDTLYVGNILGHSVDRYDTNGNFIDSLIVNVFWPTSLTVDSNDELFLTSSTEIYRYNSSGTQLAQWGGYSGNNLQDGLFIGSAQYIEVVNGNVWVAESDSRANRLQEFTVDGTFQGTLGSLGDGQLLYPTALAIDSGGILNVVDTNMRVQSLDTSTGIFQSKFGEYGTGDGQIFSPTGLALDSSGNRYVAGYSSVSKFDASGNFVSKWGSSGTDDGQFIGMSDIISDASGNIYVADTSNHRIQKFDSDGNFVTKWATNSYPVDLDFDSNGDLLVVSRWGSTVQKFSPSGTDLGEITLENGGSYTLGVALDSADNIYTMEFNSGNGYVAMYSPTGDRWGQWGEAGAGDLQFSFGTISNAPDIAIDSNDHIFIADTYNNRVQEFTHDFQLTIDSNVLDDGEVSSAYSDAVDYSGSRDNLTFSVTSGSLPTGLVLDTATGAITGTPTTAGNSSFTIQAQDDVYSDTENFTIHISPAQTAPDVTTATADNIDIESANLHGTTSPKGVTERGFEYGLTNSYGTSVSDVIETQYEYVGDFSYDEPPVGWYGDFFESDLDGNLYVGVSQNNAETIVKFNGNGDLLGTIGSDGYGNGQFAALAGFTVDSAQNVYGISFYNKRVQKFNSSGNYVTSWSVGGSPRAITVDDEDNIYVSSDINNTITKYSSAGSVLATWDISALTGGNPDSYDARDMDIGEDGFLYAAEHPGTIGKYSLDGTSVTHFSVQGTDPGQIYWPVKIYQTDDKIFLTDSVNRMDHVFSLDGEYLQRWSAAPANTPAGVTADFKGNILSMNNSNDISIYSQGFEASLDGLNCGTTYHYRAYATNNVGTAYGDDQTFTTDACPQVGIITEVLPDGQVAEAYSQTIATSGGAGTQLFEVSAGSLPSGLALNSANGEISGTATTAGDFTFDITVTDDYSSDSIDYTISIDPLDNPLDISTLNLPDGTVDEAYSADVDSTNGLGDVAYALSSGSLPTGLTLNQTTGEITGTPTVAGNYDIDITASDDYSTDTQNYSFTIAEAPAPDPINITTAALSDGTIDVAYSATISSENGVGDVSYSVVDGALPDGLSLSTGGVISGTPTDPGTFQFTVRVTDDNSSDDQVLQIVIYPAQEPSDDTSNDDSSDSSSDSDNTSTDDTTIPTSPAMYIDTHYLLDGQVGEAYLGQILVKYSSGSLIFTLIDGNLPEGLSLTTTGYISGIPSEAGEYTFSIKAKSDNGSDAEQYTIEVTDDGAETAGGTSVSGGSKEEQIAAQTEEISKTNATLADMIASFAKRLNITPKQALYGAPWAIVGVFAVFTAVSISQMLAQAKYYQDTKKRQAVHKKLLSEKATFLSLASHYLRTPFTVIKGGIDLAAKTVSDATKGMRDATEKLGEKINDVIERIENENKK